MAKPIKETPILKGADAAKFREQNKTVQKISAEERARIKENFKRLNSIAQF
ncbi:hypothetical protein [Emticicia sp. C21]|uniref:hypothetical protein n=1 Tax=Emticicia sp. C21 TaxID=2302915 RepID=UPI001314A3D9|nr:hypothetical protein [Emticicia sp. C21]